MYSVLAPQRLARLRAATFEQHRRLDAHVLQLDAWTTRAGYVSFLQAMHRLHSAGDAVLEQADAASVWADWPRWRPLASLEQELSALRAPLLRGIGSLSALHGAGAVLGTTYVLVGASLGAKVLHPQAVAGGVCPAGAEGYLSRQARDTRSWPSMLRCLDATPLGEWDEHDMVEAAVRTFALAERCLAPDYHEAPT